MPAEATRQTIVPPGTKLMTRARPSMTCNRDTLRQVVESLTEGMIVYERDGTLSFANVKALEMHGNIKGIGTHLGAYAELFDLHDRNGKKLAELDYPASRALRGETLKDVVVDVAPREAKPLWVHRVNSIRLKDDDGNLDLVVIVLHDLTGARDAERRFEQIFAANPAPSIICRIGDLRFVRVNDGFLEMTGYGRDNVIGHSIYEIDVLEGVQRRERAIHNLEAGTPIARMQAELRLAGGGTKPVVVAGQPIEIDAQACMLFTFVDLSYDAHWSTSPLLSRVTSPGRSSS